MNINVARMAPTSRALRGCERELKRIADGIEAWLAYQGIHMQPHQPDTSGDEPGVFYTDEAADFEREWLEKQGKQPKDVPVEE